MKTQQRKMCLILVCLGVLIPSLSLLAAWQPGLQAGYIDLTRDTVNYPTVTEQQLGPHAGATNSFPPWADNRTWVYTGQIYLNGVTCHFAEAIDNDAMRIIEGTTYINDTVHITVAKSGPVALPAGWYDVEIRFAMEPMAPLSSAHSPMLPIHSVELFS